jgi:hypothetical protein
MELMKVRCLLHSKDLCKFTIVPNGKNIMPQVDTKITKWYVEVALPNPNIEPIYRPLYEVDEKEERLRVANEEDLITLLEDEIMFLDTYNQAEDFAINLTATYGFFARVKEYVT